MGWIESRTAPVAVALLALVVAGCTPSAADDTSGEDLEAINQIRETEMRAFSSGDREALDEIFADDALVMPPGQPTVEGVEARNAWLDDLYSQVSVEGSYTGSDVTLAGDYAFERMRFNLRTTPVGGGEPIEETGRGLHIYERQPDGSWRIVLDIWNTVGPPGGSGGG